MSIFKEREKKDSVKPTELKESVGSSGEEVGVKVASITLKSALGLKGRKNRGRRRQFGVTPGRMPGVTSKN